MKRADRKTKIEAVANAAISLSADESIIAWARLCGELDRMSQPEARPPRFKGLLRAIWVAATNEQS